MYAELSDEEIVHRVLQAERDLVAMRFKHSMNQLPNTASMREVRASIARLRTEARAREIQAGLDKNTLFARHRGSFAPGGRPTPGASSGAAGRGGFLSGIVDKLTGKE